MARPAGPFSPAERLAVGSLVNGCDVKIAALGVAAAKCFQAKQACRCDHTEEEVTAKQAVHTFRETKQPIERDDAEARQLLQLSRLEGRDPLQDAVAGRLALDRLDAVADGEGDPDEVRWADALRRELRERFNDIAPTKFEVPRT